MMYSLMMLNWYEYQIDSYHYYHLLLIFQLDSNAQADDEVGVLFAGFSSIRELLSNKLTDKLNVLQQIS